MTKAMTTGLATFLGILFFAGQALSIDMNLMTGRERGTYYQFGLDLQQLLKSEKIDLGVQPSAGSIENLYAVYKRPNTQVGIVQADVLGLVTRIRTNPALVRIARKIKLVFPLYDEEVHLLGNKHIKDFDGLQDKRVALGEDGSGTFLTARLLLEITGIKPAQTFAIGAEEALAKLKANEIDAMFYVAGYPVKLFSEGVSEANGLALIPITNAKATEYYLKTRIPAQSYAWQDSEIDTVAVKAVLVSYDFSGMNCDNVGRLAKIIYENLDWLRQNGHAKWKSVDLDSPLKGWTQYECVRKYLDNSAATRSKPGEINPVMEAVKEILGK